MVTNILKWFQNLKNVSKETLNQFLRMRSNHVLIPKHKYKLNIKVAKALAYNIIKKEKSQNHYVCLS